MRMPAEATGYVHAKVRVVICGVRNYVFQGISTGQGSRLIRATIPCPYLNSTVYPIEKSTGDLSAAQHSLVDGGRYTRLLFRADKFRWHVTRLRSLYM